jgi:putative peptidoglycan lipid II flippase
MAETITSEIPSKRVFRLSHISKSVLIIAIFFGFDKVLALARQIIIGRTFALSRELDAFNAANNLPDMLYAMITGGALAIALIPVLSATLEQHGLRSMWDLFSRVVNLGFLVTAGLAVVIALTADRLVGWRLGIAPGFDDPLQRLVIDLMRLNLVGTLIFSLSGMVMAGLQANQHFLFPALAPALYNLGQIFGAAVLAPSEGISLGPVTLPAFGLGIHGLLYGVLIGAALHLAIQIPGLIKYKFHWIPRIDLRNPDLGKVLVLMGPRLISMVFIQLIFVARDNLASRVSQGAVSALTYGWFIMQVPETLIGTAIATALLPSLAELISRGKREEFSQTINRSLKAILALTLPIGALVIAGIRPVVQLAFNFTPEDTELVVWATRAFTLGLMGHSVFEVAARAFYAQQDPKPPVLTSGYRFVAYLVMAILLFRPYGAAGIGLADAVAITSEAAILFYILNRRFPGILKVGWTLPRAAVGALAGGLVVFLILEFVPLSLIPLTAAALAAGAVVAFPFMWPELKGLMRL